MKSGRTLLLVDDEENIRRALTRVLRREGYTILQAGSGAQALELLQAHPETGVILSDQRMPHMTGIEFLSQARRMYPDMVRIVLSGYTNLNTVTDAINQGEIYKFFTKPWEDDLLCINVREAFEHFELSSENKRLAQELQQVNTELEQRVEEKTREVTMNIHALQISQEVLEHLPVGVVGIDLDGLLVIANQLAQLWLTSADQKNAGGLIGQAANEILPAEIYAQINNVLEGKMSAPVNVHLADKILNIHCGRMGQSSQAQGVIMVMTPEQQGKYES